MGIVESLAEAREAFERHDWVTSYDRFVDAVDLDAEDLARFGIVALMRSNQPEALRALQRAYQAKLDLGDRTGAARCGFWVARTLFNSGEASVGAGWLARVRRLVEEEQAATGDTVAAGYLSILVLFQKIIDRDLEGALSQARTITDYGRRFGDPDLVAMGLSAEGRILVESGSVRNGLVLFDEAMAAVAAGEVSPLFAGEVYCTMIEGCQRASDVGRAADWTTVLTDWCADQPGLVVFTGQSAVHRGQIMKARGAFKEALEEFAHARDRYLAGGGHPAAGLALSEAGDVHRLLGDYDAAEHAYEQAATHGHEPQPGLALLWMARGKSSAAVAAARRLLAERAEPLERAAVLPAAVEILLSAGEVEDASSISDELTHAAESFGSTALLATAAQTAASVALARPDPAGALPYLRRAMAQWTSLEAPYEVARCRLRIGEALSLLGDQDSAHAELLAARKSFSELGTAPVLKETERMLNPSRPAGLTERELEVLRLVAGGRSNSEIAETLVLSEKTVARHLSNIFTKIEVGSRTAAAAYAFENHLV